VAGQTTKTMKGFVSVNREGVLLAIARRKSKVENRFARVAKLADAPDLGSGGEILRGSSPLPGTFKGNKR
jgi:hypothetical protein